MTDYHVEQLLESLDASAQRSIRATLRSRLVALHQERQPFLVRRSRLAVGLALLGLLLAAVLLTAPAASAFAQTAIITIVQVFELNDNTSFTSVEGNFAVTELENGERQITALSDEDVEAWVEPAPVGTTETNDDLESFTDEADLASAGRMPVPAYVPEGFSFVSAYRDGAESAVDYSAPDGSLFGIRQVQGQGIHVTATSDIPVEETSINGYRATISLPSDLEVQLLWAIGDTSYEMMSYGLSPEEAVRIAESIQSPEGE